MPVEVDDSIYRSSLKVKVTGQSSQSWDETRTRQLLGWPTVVQPELNK